MLNVVKAEILPMRLPAKMSLGWCQWSTSLEEATQSATETGMRPTANWIGGGYLACFSLNVMNRVTKSIPFMDRLEWPEGNDIRDLYERSELRGQ